MATGRIHGCPFDVGDWSIQAKDPDAAAWTPVGGIRRLSRRQASEHTDAGPETALYEEPLITRRRVSYTLEGDLLYDPAAGRFDPGQELLREYAALGGCGADLNLRVADPYGHAVFMTAVVDSFDDSSGEDGKRGIRVELLQVGEAEREQWMLPEAVAFWDGDTLLSDGALSLPAGGEPRAVTVRLSPPGVANRRFKTANSARRVAAVTGVDEGGFTLTPLAPGVTVVTVTTLSGAVSADLTVTVTGGAGG